MEYSPGQSRGGTPIGVRIPAGMRGRAQQHGRLATASVGVPFPFFLLARRKRRTKRRHHPFYSSLLSLRASHRGVGAKARDASCRENESAHPPPLSRGRMKQKDITCAAACLPALCVPEPHIRGNVPPPKRPRINRGAARVMRRRARCLVDRLARRRVHVSAGRRIENHLE